jgi:hypothetical protein
VLAKISAHCNIQQQLGPQQRTSASGLPTAAPAPNTSVVDKVGGNFFHPLLSG